MCGLGVTYYLSRGRVIGSLQVSLACGVGSNPIPATIKKIRRWCQKKEKKKNKKNSVGRPRRITEEVLHQLKEAFMMGCTNREACFYADIPESTFYDFLKEFPEYSDKIVMWKEYEKIKARMVVHKALDKGDKDMAKWYLERRVKEEFSTKQEVDATINNKVIIVDDLPVGEENSE